MSATLSCQFPPLMFPSTWGILYRVFFTGELIPVLMTSCNISVLPGSSFNTRPNLANSASILAAWEQNLF